MALINCPECGKEISDMAKSCPNCGYNSSKIEIKNNKISLIMGIISFFIGVFFIFANSYWLLYGIALILLGIFDIIFYKNKTFVVVVGMLYTTLGLFALITIPAPSGKIFVFICYAVYSIIFLVKGFSRKQ